VAAGVIRVMLADDQRVVREGLGTLLGLLDGIELVATAADGEEAVALAAAHDPDVVLMDLRMPRVDGIEAIRRLAARGEAALDPSVQHHVVAALAGSDAGGPSAAGEPGLPDELTPREAEVLGLIAEGLTNAEIAEQLVVSAATVKTHVNHIFAKAGVRDRAQAVVYAYSHGLAG
jgi:DNA-binding NarL/FixJ family response regulator